MRTAKSWVNVIDAAANLGAKGELERQIKRVQVDVLKSFQMKNKEIREICAKICESMVVAGKAWTKEQQTAGNALFQAADNIRDNDIFNQIKKENEN